MDAVGVLGCTGAVGSLVVELLSDLPLRLGSSSTDLAEFVASCSLVVDCAGPAHLVGGRVLQAAAAEGVDYVGAGEPPGEVGELRAVVGAGMMPGLSTLLPKALAVTGDRLTAYVGGRDRFTPAAAADYLAGMDSSRARKAWLDGHLVPAEPVHDVPYFPSGVSAHPFLSEETERLARTLGLTEASWYHVFDGELALQAVTDPEQLVRAAGLETFGRERYQLMVFELDGRTLVLRATNSYALTAEVTAFAARAMLAGQVPRGKHRAGEVLDPKAMVDRLVVAPSVRHLEIVEHAVALEEGAL